MPSRYSMLEAQFKIRMRRMMASLGHEGMGLVAYIGGLAVLTAKTSLYALRPLGRQIHLASQMMRVGVQTLPVSGLIVLLIGMVIALQTAYQMKTLGGEDLIPGLVAITMTRELSPVLTAIIVAGRAGAAMTAEIGSMSVTEQVDAIEAMAVDPVKYLVAPRFLATVLMIPLLTIYTDFIGLLGGYVICLGQLGMSSDFFINSVFEVMTLSDVLSGLIKSVIFGAAISLVACFEGLRVSGGAEGVGTATRRSVVVSFIMIVVADFIFTVLFYMLPI